jgi:hypothetical protein
VKRILLHRRCNSDSTYGRLILVIWDFTILFCNVFTLWKVDQKYLESFEILCWKRMEISWTDREK